MPKKEYSPNVECYPPLVEAFAQTFLSRTDCYPLQLADGKYTCVKQPLTLDMVIAHLKGHITIGAYALDAENHAKWLCLDADDMEAWKALLHLAHQLEGEGVTPYLETSRRGGHLWLFTLPLSGKEIRQFAQGLVKQYDLPKLECYPKQDELKTGPGSQVRLPLGVHRKTGQRYPFISTKGQRLAPTIAEQMALLSAPRLIPTDFVYTLIKLAQDAEIAHYTPPLPKVQKPSGEYLSERLKRAISVYAFVSHYVILDPQGKGLCPFHDDHIQSFQVNIEANYWSCYAGCGGGSLIDFWMKWRQLHGQDNNFKATLKDLAQQLF